MLYSKTIRKSGTQEASVPEMLTRARLYDLVDYEGYNQFDTGVFNFSVPTVFSQPVQRMTGWPAA
ncbi:hypothetical protein [Arthrobacter sp. ISL-72]|uniref:hypothetical protein n=1 Tax=Arthrobacter sp. ISL-72 TaxID=2819114 RepID=UPI0037C11FBE